MNEQGPTAETPQASIPTDGKPQKPTHWIWSLLKWSPIVFVPALVGVILWAMYFLDSLYGPAIQNAIAFGASVLLSLMLIVWFTLCAPLGRSAVLGFWILLICGGAGFAASVESISFSGDMYLTIRYRWKEGTMERLKERSGPSEADIAVSNSLNFSDYRGPLRDGHISGPNLKQNWQSPEIQETWRIPVGDGYAGVTVVGNMVLTLEQREDAEALICLDRETGQLIWEHSYTARFFEAMGGLGPRSTPVISGETVITQGATGEIYCLNLENGEVVWNRNFLTENEYPNITWGLSSSPLIVDQLVYVNAGGPQGKGMAALNVLNGEVVWSDFEPFPTDAKPGALNFAGYSSPMLAELCGKTQLLHFDGIGIRSYEPMTGEELWFSKFGNGAGVSVAQPLTIEQDKLFLSESYGVGSALLQLTAPTEEQQNWKVETLWHEERVMRSKFTCPVLIDNYVYGLDEGILSCVDPLTGKRVWRKERLGHGQVLVSNNQLLILSEKGELVLVNPTPERYDEITRLKVLTQSARNWNPPTLHEGEVYVRDEFELARYDLGQTQNDSPDNETNDKQNAE